MQNIKIIKKDGIVVNYNPEKIKRAATLSAERVMVHLTEDNYKEIVKVVEWYLKKWGQEEYTIEDVHVAVEESLEAFNPKIAKSYKDYRNYKKEHVASLDKIYKRDQSIRFIGDKENSNTNSALVTTKRILTYNELNKEFYNRFDLTPEERLACKDGYIYIHDKSSRRDTMNCCLYDCETVMTGGFEMGNKKYVEPKSITVACAVLGDLIADSTGQQYGGWSTRIDNLLVKYCEKSYAKYSEEYWDIAKDLDPNCAFDSSWRIKGRAHEYALKKTIRDLEQGAQGLEMKLNTVGSSRGDFPFVTFALGLDKSFWGKEISKAFLRVRMEGQGDPGFKKPVLFPKLVFLYDEELHGEGKELEDVFEVAIDCSSKCMYPDFLSLSGDGYVPEMYKKYNKVVFPMGCRAFLSPWYTEGGMIPKNDKDAPVFIGRFNVGSL